MLSASQIRSPIAEDVDQYARGDNEWKNYQSVCSGDSGGAVWMMEENEDRNTEMIAIQIAVTTRSTAPCGHQDFADKISYPRILEWIAGYWKKLDKPEKNIKKLDIKWP